MRSVEWAFIHCCWCPYEKRYRDAHGEGHVRRRQRLEKCVYKPRIDRNIRGQEKDMEQILF